MFKQKQPRHRRVRRRQEKEKEKEKEEEEGKLNKVVILRFVQLCFSPIVTTDMKDLLCKRIPGRRLRNPFAGVSADVLISKKKKKKKKKLIG